MNISLEKSGRLVISLSYNDLLKMGLTFHTLNYKSPESKAAIGALLSKAVAETGFNYYPGRLQIEAYPAPEMGCTLYFTRLPPANSRPKFRRQPETPYIFEFDCADDMLDGVEQLYSKCRADSALYQLGNKYRLMLFSALTRQIHATLSEYGVPIGSEAADAAYTAEHGKLLCKNAVDVIGGCLLKRTKPI